MRWVFESDAREGLKVINSIPDINPCLLEGRNGVGKTVAIQLLELVSGAMPPEFVGRPELWLSLKKRLGATKVVGSELTDVESVEFLFTPQLWPDDPKIGIEELGEVRIDGERSDCATLARLLNVERISGTEDLAETIVRHRDVLQAQLSKAGSRIRLREQAMQEFANDLLVDLLRADPQDMERDVDLVKEAEARAREAEKASHTADGRLKALLKAQETKLKRDAVDRDADDLLSRRDAAVVRIRDLGRHFDAAQAEANKLAQALEAEGGVAQQLANASRQLRTRHNRLSTLQRSVADTAKRLGIDPDGTFVEEAIAACDDERLRLDEQRRSLDSTGEVRAVLEDILPALRSALPDAGDHLLADGFSPELTVESAYAGMDARHLLLATEPTPSQVRDLLERIFAVTQRRDALQSLTRELGTLARQQELVDEAAVEYNESQSKAQSATETAQASRAADEKVGGLQSELNTAHDELATLAQQIAAHGTMSREDANRDVQQFATELGVAESEFAGLELQFRQASAAADHRLGMANQAVVSARRRAATRAAEIEQTVSRLQTDSRYNWLGQVHPLRGVDGEADLASYQRVREAILSAIEAISQAAEIVARLEGLCREFLRPRSSETSELDARSEPLVRPFAGVLAARLLAALNTPSIQARVFGGAEAIEMDPVNRTLTLRSAAGDVDTRPMASFSTGEQAFAFTQARILDIEPSSKPNRLLVLDEFGAFVSADRLPDLAAFLSTDGVAAIADQVVVVLPLQVNYEVEVANTRGALRVTYEERLAQIREFDYCAVPL